MLTALTTYDNSQVSKKSKSIEFVLSTTYLIDNICMQLTYPLLILSFVLSLLQSEDASTSQKGKQICLRTCVHFCNLH